MRDKMLTEKGKKVYDLRKITAESVIGNIKQNLGFREFLLRGLENVKVELNLVCIAHNLQKIWKLVNVSQSHYFVSNFLNVDEKIVMNKCPQMFA